MQTVKLSTGDKTPPTLDDSIKKRLEGHGKTKSVFMFFLELVWALQQVISLVFGLNSVTKVMFSYEQTMKSLELLNYQSRAKFNEENYQIMYLIKRLPQFKVIFFQLDKKIQRDKYKIFEGFTRTIDKHIKRSENKKRLIKKDDDNQRKKLIELQKSQLEMLDDLKRDICNRPFPQERQGQ